MTQAHDIALADGRNLRAYDTGVGDTTVIWQPGSPSTGGLFEPLLREAADRGIRLVGYARPSYGGSTPQRGRTVRDAAADVRTLADTLGLDRFAVLGYSGGGPHALACAALLPDRVTAAITFASLAPFDGEDWFAGMAGGGPSLRAAVEGRAAREAFAEEFDPDSFNARDYAALEGDWVKLGNEVGAAAAWGEEGIVDDDLAFVNPWGFAPAEIRVPTLLVHGDDDRVVPFAHARRLERIIPAAELRPRPGDGHVAVLGGYAASLDWLLQVD
ncbi:MAG: alpha/beta hydrolase [Microbacteriaceae bacterium]|nr:alpha/beta hydrolase [Microbacteriaceae bacterium]